MPTSLNLDGLRIYRPGVYAVIDASALGGSGVSTGNVAIVGEFPSIEQASPLTFTSARAVKDYDPDDLYMQTIARTAFAPSTDDRVPGGAATLTIVNIVENTQAQYPGAKDLNGADSLVLKSSLWGAKGNQMFAALTVNPGDSNALDITIGKGSASETYTGLQSGPVADFYYEGTDLDYSLLSVDPTNLNWMWGKEHTFAGGLGLGDPQSQVYDPVTDAVVSNGSALQFSVQNGTGLAAGKTLTISVVGKDSTGAAVTGTATITEAEYAGDPSITKTLESGGSPVQWGQVESVTYSTDQGTFAGSTLLTGTAYALTLADFNYVGEVAALIDNNSNLGWHADAIHPRINKIPSTEIDKQASVDVHNGAGASSNKLTARCDLWAILEALQTSRLVEASRASGAEFRPGPASLSGYSEQLFFVGGSETAATDADYDDALAAIEYADIQIVVGMADTLVVAKKLAQHCTNAAVAGYERNAYFGCPKNKTLKQAFDEFSSKINSRHVAMAAQEVYLEDATGALKWMDPSMMAVMVAGMQAGTAVATPLTYKRPSVYDVRSLWDPSRDANEAISKGIVNISKDTLGFKIERSVTTWLEDDNPIFSEVSSNESVNTSVRDLRAALAVRVGDALYGGTAAKLRSVVEGRLNQQIREGFIKSWRNVSLEDLGDTIRVNYEVAAVEPLNFMLITASVVRIPSDT